MIARRMPFLLVLVILVALAPAAAQSGDDDGYYLDPPRTLGGGPGGDAGGPWPGGLSDSLAVRIAPSSEDAPTNAGLLPVPGGLLLAWPAWDGHDTEIAVAVLDGSGAARARLVTRNGRADVSPTLLPLPGGRVLLAWVHRGRDRREVRVVRLRPDGTPEGRPRALGPAGRQRLLAVLPGERVALLRLAGSPRRPRLELVLEGAGREPLTRLAPGARLLGVAPGPGGGAVFRFRDGALRGRLDVAPDGTFAGIEWSGD